VAIRSSLHVLKDVLWDKIEETGLGEKIIGEERFKICILISLRTICFIYNPHQGIYPVLNNHQKPVTMSDNLIICQNIEIFLFTKSLV
jgi:hypothetical protein